MALSVLVVDDDELSRAALARRLGEAGCRVRAVGKGSEASRALAHELFDVLLAAPGTLDFLQAARRRRPGLPVVLITDVNAVERVVRALAAAPPRVDLLDLRTIIRHSSTMREVVERPLALALADSTLGVLLTGETGTGKSMLARLIHEHSARRQAPFVSVSCAELDPNLVESELFGHELGSLTGVFRDGRLKAASGGTLFIDDVDHLPIELQMRLLRLLRDRTLERLGLEADVRVLCAAGGALEELMLIRGLAEDIHPHGNVLHVAPLRDRAADIVPLAEHFAARFSAADRHVPALLADAERALLAYQWPGNVRELEHAMEHAVTFAAGEAVGLVHLPPQLRCPDNRPILNLDLDSRESVSFERVVYECERELMEWALSRTGGNQVQAARLLGLSRTTLRGRLAAVHRDPAETKQR